MSLHTSPLDATHRALGAKLVPFGVGHADPVPDRHARRAPGVPGRRRRLRRQPPGHRAGRGHDALAALQGAFTSDLGKIGPGARSTHLLDEADASVLDDIIVWWVDGEQFDVMPNASNTSRSSRPSAGTT